MDTRQGPACAASWCSQLSLNMPWGPPAVAVLPRGGTSPATGHWRLWHRCHVVACCGMLWHRCHVVAPLSPATGCVCVGAVVLLSPATSCACGCCGTALTSHRPPVVAPLSPANGGFGFGTAVFWSGGGTSCLLPEVAPYTFFPSRAFLSCLHALTCLLHALLSSCCSQTAHTLWSAAVFLAWLSLCRLAPLGLYPPFLTPLCSLQSPAFQCTAPDPTSFLRPSGTACICSMRRKFNPLC